MDYSSYKHSEDRFVIDYLEKLRIERDIKIKDFTEGIMSVRNYSRLISHESEITFEDLDAFLNKLQVPLFQFGGYMRNSMIVDNMVVFQFLDAIASNNIQEAYEKFYPQIKDKAWDCPISRKHLPISILFMKYKLNKMTKAQALYEINKELELSTMINAGVVYGDDVTLLLTYLEICNEQAKKLIADFLFKALFTNKVKVLTSTGEPTRIMMYICILKAIITRDKISKIDHTIVKKVLEDFIAYHKKAKTELLDYDIFHYAYLYIKKFNLKNDYIIFHYIGSIISTGPKWYFSGKKIQIRKEDMDVFISMIGNQEMKYAGMYERLSAYDII
jgi:hypothetical protein